MKALIRLVCASILMFTSIPFAFAVQRVDFSHLKYYGGIDLQQRAIELKRNYGENLFANRIPQLNLYFGTKINDYFGFEIGYQASNEEQKNATLYPGESLLATIIDPAEVDFSTNKIRMRGSHFNVVGFIPVTEVTQLVGSAGIAMLNVRLIYKQIGNQTALFAPADWIERVFSSRRVIPRVSGGFQHRFSESYGIRGTLGYEQTEKFRKLFPKNRENSPLRASLKNSVIYSVGGFFYF